jgi:SSS family solute:Na+ symporter
MPVFIMKFLPGFPAGIALATLLIAIVGTGAGLSLGISSMLSSDIYKTVLRPKASDKELLWISRGIIGAVLLLAAWLSLGEAGSLILGWSFLSMGLRGAVAFIPMCFALFVKKPIPRPFAVASMIAGPALVIAGQYILPAHIDSLFLGIAGTLVICTLGCVAIRRKNHV